MAATFFSHLSPQSLPLFLTLKEAKAYSGLSEERLKRLVHEGTVFGFTRDPGYRISRKSLDAFAEGPGTNAQKNIPPVARNGRKKT
jgi:helix-turn-helix protein